MTATVIDFPVHSTGSTETVKLRLIEHALANLEESLWFARGRLPRSTGRDRERYEEEIGVLEREHARLERMRLRIAGPELAVKPGGAL